MIGFNSGEASRKLAATQKRTHELKSPESMGTVEHEQKGVIAPMSAPITFPAPKGSERLLLALWPESTYCCSSPTPRATIKKSTTSSTAMTENVRAVFNNVPLSIKILPPVLQVCAHMHETSQKNTFSTKHVLMVFLLTPFGLPFLHKHSMHARECTWQGG